MSSRGARPIFCGNLDYDARQSDIERLFGKYGNVERVDLKSGFAFVYMEDEQDADDAVRRLDRREFGAKGRRLRVEWTKQDRGGRRSDDSRKSSMNSKPSRTLFVINFDPISTRPRDLERHFDPYGKIVNVRIRRNFAFVQFDTQEEATRALDATNSSKFMDRIISVEYATRDDDDDNQRTDSRRNGRSPDRRGRDRSPERGYNSRRSPSPYRRARDSPDYGHGSKPITRYEPRRSPSYERNKSPYNNIETRRSPSYERKMTPNYERQRSPSYERKRSPSYERKRSQSYERHERKRSISYAGGLDKSPVTDHGAKQSYDDTDRSPVAGHGVDLSYDSRPRSPVNDRGANVDSEHVPYESPGYDRAERSPEGYYSRSPSPAERGRT